MPVTVPTLADALRDRYRIERQVGKGGMATVLLAYDLRHERKVAIKVLRPDLAAVIGAERFLREIKTIARLRCGARPPPPPRRRRGSAAR